MQLVMGHRHAVLGARAGQAHDVLRADVRGEDRGADDPPAEIAAGQEVIGRGVLASADDPPGHAEEECEIAGPSLSSQAIVSPWDSSRIILD